jgi:hypothetical protein
MIYVPNVGEMEALKDILVSQAFRLGLYKTHVTPDGNTVFSTMTELDTEADGYATKDLSNDICEDALTADKWYLAVNADGKAEATYDADDTPQEWVFNAADVANSDTAYGIFMWTLTIDFTSGGTTELKVGDTITSVAADPDTTAICTAIRLTSGTWAGGTAAGTMCLKTQSGALVAGAINNTGGVDDFGTIAGDTDKKIILVEAFSAGQAIDTVGQKIQYTPKITLSTS